MKDNQNDITGEFYKVLQRFHNCKPKFRGDGDLANVEFFILMGISALLDAKEGRLVCPEIENVFSAGETDMDEEGITLGEIMKASEMSMSALSKKISIFEKKGYVKRKPSKRDRRNVYITLTEKGKEICEQEKEKKRLLTQELISEMGDEDMMQLLVLANKAFDIMEGLGKE